MRRILLPTMAAIVLAACRPAPQVPAPSPTLERPAVEVALVSASDGPSGAAAMRAMQGARLALDLQNQNDELPVVLVPTAYETSEDPERAAQAMDEIAASQDTVAVISFPGGPDAPVVRQDRGIATLDLSPAGASGSGAWGRLVATDARVAERLAHLAGPRKACLVSDEAPRSQALAEGVRAALRDRGLRVALDEQIESQQGSYPDLLSAVEEARCHSLVWLGGAQDGATVVVDAAEAGTQLRLLGTDRMLSDAFVDQAKDDGDGSLAVCPCIDVTTRTDLETQRFVQDYQVQQGVPPTTYAVEGWDAAQRLIEAIAEVGADRAALAEALTPPSASDGLGRPYEIAADGESPTAPLVTYEVRSGRWVSDEATGPKT